MLMKLIHLMRWLRKSGVPIFVDNETNEIRLRIYLDTIRIKLIDKKLIDVAVNGIHRKFTVKEFFAWLKERYPKLLAPRCANHRIHVVAYIPSNIKKLLDKLAGKGIFPNVSEAIRYFIMRGLENEERCEKHSAMA